MLQPKVLGSTRKRKPWLKGCKLVRDGKEHKQKKESKVNNEEIRRIGILKTIDKKKISQTKPVLDEYKMCTGIILNSLVFLMLNLISKRRKGKKKRKGRKESKVCKRNVLNRLVS